MVWYLALFAAHFVRTERGQNLRVVQGFARVAGQDPKLHQARQLTTHSSFSNALSNPASSGRNNPTQTPAACAPTLHRPADDSTVSSFASIAAPELQHRRLKSGWRSFVPLGVFSCSTRWRCVVAVQYVFTDGSETPFLLPARPNSSCWAAPAAWLCLCAAAKQLPAGALPGCPCPLTCALSSTDMHPSPLIMPPPPPCPCPAACRPTECAYALLGATLRRGRAWQSPQPSARAGPAATGTDPSTSTHSSSQTSSPPPRHRSSSFRQPLCRPQPACAALCQATAAACEETHSRKERDPSLGSDSSSRHL